MRKLHTPPTLWCHDLDLTWLKQPQLGLCKGQAGQKPNSGRGLMVEAERKENPPQRN